ncbi:MAG: outer membrane protein assembly factor BamD [Myxococcota bacterium]
MGWSETPGRRQAYTGASAALAVVLLWGCASAPPVEEVPSAESYYRRGLEVLQGRRVLLFLHDVDYPHAIELFQEVIDNYPYSEFATLAELKIADVHFEQDNYEEAASYYQDFVELHPRHAQVPYSIYRNGLCSFRSMRGVDQDQTPTHEAIAQFRVLLERYPESPLAAEAHEKLQEAVDQLAEHELEVAEFYIRRGDYHAAARRYRRALDLYPEHSRRLYTLEQLARVLQRMDRHDEADRILQRVSELRAAEERGETPDSHYVNLGADDLSDRGR